MNGESELSAIACDESGTVVFDVSPNMAMIFRKSKSVAVARDGRTMNHMDPETKQAHLRLEQWGLETRDNLTGYPPVTLLGRLMRQGPMGAGQAGMPPVTLSEPAARVDVCVAKLCQIDQRVLRYYYQHWVGTDEVARVMKMRERQARNVLRRARWRFMAHLDAMEG